MKTLHLAEMDRYENHGMLFGVCTHDPGVDGGREGCRTSTTELQRKRRNKSTRRRYVTMADPRVDPQCTGGKNRLKPHSKNLL